MPCFNAVDFGGCKFAEGFRSSLRWLYDGPDARFQHMACRCRRGMLMLARGCVQVNAQCTDTIGSFTCDCNRGYTGNGVNCDLVPAHAHARSQCLVMMILVLTLCCAPRTGVWQACTTVTSEPPSRSLLPVFAPILSQRSVRILRPEPSTLRLTHLRSLLGRR